MNGMLVGGAPLPSISPTVYFSTHISYSEATLVMKSRNFLFSPISRGNNSKTNVCSPSMDLESIREKKAKLFYPILNVNKDLLHIASLLVSHLLLNNRKNKSD